MLELENAREWAAVPRYAELLGFYNPRFRTFPWKDTKDWTSVIGFLQNLQFLPPVFGKRHDRDAFFAAAVAALGTRYLDAIDAYRFERTIEMEDKLFPTPEGLVAHMRRYAEPRGLPMPPAVG